MHFTNDFHNLCSLRGKYSLTERLRVLHLSHASVSQLRDGIDQIQKQDVERVVLQLCGPEGYINSLFVTF